jgi:hypothetical protein
VSRREEGSIIEEEWPMEGWRDGGMEGWRDRGIEGSRKNPRGR